MQSKAVTAYSWTYLVLLVKTLSLVAVMFFTWWKSSLRAAARRAWLLLQRVVVPGSVMVYATGGEKARELLPWAVKLWWAWALPTPR